MYRDNKLFKDIKNLLNYKTYNKLKEALQNNKKIFFIRIVNGKKYNYKVVKDKLGNEGVIIRNLTDFSSAALMINKNQIINYSYNNLINEYYNRQ